MTVLAAALWYMPTGPRGTAAGPYRLFRCAPNRRPGAGAEARLLAPEIGLSTSIRFYVSLAGLGVTAAIRLSSPLSGPDLGDHGGAGLLFLFLILLLQKAIQSFV